MSGIELAKRVRALRHKTYILCVIDSKTSKTKIRGENAGINEFITKPYNIIFRQINQCPPCILPKGHFTLSNFYKIICFKV